MLELMLSPPVILSPRQGDYALTRRLTGRSTLTFELLPGDESLPRLREELPIRDTETNLLYRIKGLSLSEAGASVTAALALDDWETMAYTAFSRTAATPEAVLRDILPSGWSLRMADMVSATADITLEFGGTPLDIAEKIRDTFDLSLEYDNFSHLLTVARPSAHPISDTLLTEGADLRRLPDYTGKSTELCTRLYPVGAEGTTIASVNDGKPYVENFSYTTRIIARVWKDERYTIPAHLKAAAETMLSTLCQPETAWELETHDLYRQNPAFWQGHRAVLGQKIRVSAGGRVISAMIVEETLHPDPARNTLCVGSVPATTIGSIGALRDEILDPNSSFNAEKAAAIENATRLITGSRGGHVVTVLDSEGKPEELCILTDTEDISTAQSLWRWNEGGLGHSDSGYNGPFSMALTKDGAIVADRITVGTLNAGIVKAGILTDGLGKNQWNLETGEMELSGSATVRGQFRVRAADSETLWGHMGYLEGATGSDKTYGVGMISALDSTCYAIVTDSGARLQAGNYSVYVTKSGVIALRGSAGALEITDSGPNGPGIYLTGRLFRRAAAGGEFTYL